ncbi:hypothetical protein GCM10027186_61280 [Micromonospora schwarzwaldensis]
MLRRCATAIKRYRPPRVQAERMNRNDGLTGLLDVLQAALDDPAAGPAGLAARAHLSPS